MPPASDKPWFQRWWGIAGSVLGGLAAIAGILTFVIFLTDRLGSPTAAGTTPSHSPSSSRSPSSTATAAETRDPVLNVHAGNDVALLTQAAGVPVSSRNLDGNAGWVESLYVKGPYAMTAVTDSSGEILVYSVLVCDADHPTSFVTASGSTVTLMGPPIAVAETDDDPAVDGDALNDRQLSYLDGGTGSSLGQLLETSTLVGASGNNFMTYLVGINRACGTTNFGVTNSLGTLMFDGEAYSAPDQLRAFRASHPANFYTEVAVDFGIDTEAGTLTMVTSSGDGDLLAGGVLASAFALDLPPDFPGLAH